MVCRGEREEVWRGCGEGMWGGTGGGGGGEGAVLIAMHHAGQKHKEPTWSVFVWTDRVMNGQTSWSSQEFKCAWGLKRLASFSLVKVSRMNVSLAGNQAQEALRLSLISFWSSTTLHLSYYQRISC